MRQLAPHSEGMKTQADVRQRLPNTTASKQCSLVRPEHLQSWGDCEIKSKAMLKVQQQTKAAVVTVLIGMMAMLIPLGSLAFGVTTELNLNHLFSASVVLIGGALWRVVQEHQYKRAKAIEQQRQLLWEQQKRLGVYETTPEDTVAFADCLTQLRAMKQMKESTE